MLRIRFFRKGRKKQPFYKIVVTDKNNPPSSGRFVEDVGFYNPLTKECAVKKERVLYWIEKGAYPSGVVKNLLITKGVLEGEKVNVVSFSKKRREKMDAKAKPETPPEGESEKKEEEPKEEEPKEDVKEEAASEDENKSEEEKQKGEDDTVKERTEMVKESAQDAKSSPKEEEKENAEPENEGEDKEMK